MVLISIWNLIFMVFLVFSFMLIFFGSSFLLMSKSFYITWEIFNWGGTNINMILMLDWVSFFFLSFVLLISGSVFYYSGEYMEGELNISRFIILLAGFVMSMGFLILSPNMISILLGWDGLGLVSYCLVIYYQNYKSLNAGTLTVLSNRIGDVLFLMAIVFMLNYGDWSFTSWMSKNYSLILVSLLVVLASLTKSAQIPFSAWLPAAMAAPTPVSSLVHSSTLVTAGVYLVIRWGWVYDFWTNEALMILSALTMFMAGLGACLEYDLKKIIALSTLSQLGLMMFSISMGLIKLAFFHLLMHALFKALLFMTAGCLIHSLQGWQDIRSMGNIMMLFPFISSSFVISNLALSGMPFLAGFYSKDLILEFSLMSELNLLSFFLLFISTGLTVSYTFRLIYYLAFRDYVLINSLNSSDGHGLMVKSCIILTLFSVTFGSLMSWLLIDPCLIFMPKLMKMLTPIVCLAGLIMGFFMSHSKKSVMSWDFSFIKWFSGSMWFLPFISAQPLIKFPMDKGDDSMNLGDQGWLEILSGLGMSMLLTLISKFVYLISLKEYKLFVFILWVFFSVYIFL
uniref:NADH dehydrogenase subunit 5 n=1 Tax=Smilium sinense TaxID=1380519 RepID=UPI0021CCDBA3|nr:NADH dehydrogenase subunit 5 [Smilium sinense]UWM12991.1 NADH dehydrogenase subunit 5 [Smilium sinense]